MGLGFDGGSVTSVDVVCWCAMSEYEEAVMTRHI